MCRHIVEFKGVGSTATETPDEMRRSLYLVQEFMSGGTLKVSGMHCLGPVNYRMDDDCRHCCVLLIECTSPRLFRSSGAHHSHLLERVGGST